MKTTTTVYMSLGSNLGNRMENLEEARKELLQKVGEINAISPIYENPPNGFDAKEDFLNLCLEIKTFLTPKELLTATQEIEKALGRKKSTQPGYSSRCIDIDIILYGNYLIQEENLVVPHPHFRQRMFVLKPLNDIAAGTIDPETMLTIQQLFANCRDQSTMRIYSH